ncbi:MAG: PE-PPE domain-containing protein [Mycobacterium sp.]|jgi:PE-PPE domain/PE family
MASMFVQPQVVANAAANVADIGSMIGAANAAAAGTTAGVVAAAGDEVSAAAATLFNTYAQDYQELLKRAAVLHQQFGQALAAAGKAYVESETAAQALLGGSPAAGGVTGAADPPLPQTLIAPSVGLFMGGSGNPIPNATYINGVLNWVNQNFAVTMSNALPLFTPEGLYPVTGVKTLPVNTSVSEGITILQSAINQQLFPTSGTGAPSVAVLGYSQSSVISSLVMQNILSGNYPFQVPSTSQLGFTLLGDPMNPNGGLLERFAGLTFPSLGFDFYGATPPNTPYNTAIYTLEYDGFADFPQYPIDVLSDLNAVLGIQYVHGTYASINPNALPQGDTMIELPGSATLPGGTGATNYYMISQPNLPLLDPVRAIPIIGNPIADLAQPDLAVLVNLGYGSTAQGWSTGPANVPTPFGVIPPVSPIDVAGALAAGTQQGMSAFAGDISAGIAGIPSPNVSLPDMSSIGMSGVPSLLPAAPAPAAIDGFIQALQTANTTIVNGISGAAANAYAVLLPTADIANALATSLPSYDVNLFLDGVQQVISGDPVGGLVYAFGAPVAADAGLGTLAAGFEIDVLLNAV